MTSSRNLSNSVSPALHEQRQVEPVHVLVGEACVVDRRTERVADRVADHAEKLGVGVDRVVTVESLEGGDGQLSRSGRGLLVDAGECHKAAELLRENPADQSRPAHAQHDDGSPLLSRGAGRRRRNSR